MFDTRHDIKFHLFQMNVYFHLCWSILVQYCASRMKWFIINSYKWLSSYAVVTYFWGRLLTPLTCPASVALQTWLHDELVRRTRQPRWQVRCLKKHTLSMLGRYNKGGKKPPVRKINHYLQVNSVLPVGPGIINSLKFYIFFHLPISFWDPSKVCNLYVYLIIPPVPVGFLWLLQGWIFHPV